MSQSKTSLEGKITNTLCSEGNIPPTPLQEIYVFDMISDFISGARRKMCRTYSRCIDYFRSEDQLAQKQLENARRISGEFTYSPDDETL